MLPITPTRRAALVDRQLTAELVDTLGEALDALGEAVVDVLGDLLATTLEQRSATLGKAFPGDDQALVGGFNIVGVAGK